MWVKYDKLQKSSDIRGIATEGAGKEVTLTSEVVRSIASGFVRFLENKRNKAGTGIRIAVGMDSRLSGPALKASVIEGLTASGCGVYDCGLATTPAMFMTTILKNYECDGSIMITASHLPCFHNGLKFFTNDGGCEKEDIEEILNLGPVEEINNSTKGKVKKFQLLDEYSELLIDKIRTSVNSRDNFYKPLAGTRIIVDAGNGCGGFFAQKVLMELGADIEGSQFLDPDGSFPNHIPNPEAKEAMEAIKNAVLQNSADLGIIFDTDVDRTAIVSKDGEEINRNSLIALISSIVLEEHPGSVIVTDSVTSTGLTQFITELGGDHHRFKRGYKNVINEAKRINEEGKESWLAIETSGHAALKENYFLDDGAYLIARILIKMAKLKEEGKEITSLIESLKSPKESEEMRIKIRRENFRIYAEAILVELRDYVTKVPGWSLEPINYEGVRVNCVKDSGDGWFLLRMSLHEPVLALNLESESIGGVRRILAGIRPFLEKYSDLDL